MTMPCVLDCSTLRCDFRACPLPRIHLRASFAHAPSTTDCVTRPPSCAQELEQLKKQGKGEPEYYANVMWQKCRPKALRAHDLAVGTGGSGKEVTPPFVMKNLYGGAHAWSRVAAYERRTTRLVRGWRRWARRV